MTPLAIFLSTLAVMIGTLLIVKEVLKAQIHVKTVLNEKALEQLHKSIKDDVALMLAKHKDWVRAQEETNGALMAQSKEGLLLFQQYHKEAMSALSEMNLARRMK